MIEIHYSIKKHKQGDMPFPPIARLCCKGTSYQLISEGEIDECVASLIKDIERVGKNAKRALAKARKREREDLGVRNQP